MFGEAYVKQFSRVSDFVRGFRWFLTRVEESATSPDPSPDTVYFRSGGRFPPKLSPQRVCGRFSDDLEDYSNVVKDREIRHITVAATDRRPS